MSGMECDYSDLLVDIFLDNLFTLKISLLNFVSFHFVLESILKESNSKYCDMLAHLCKCVI